MTFGLFQRSGLEQESGIMSERWGQEGSEIINIADSSAGSGGETMLTITAGKTGYITAVIFQGDGVSASTVQIKDNATVRLYVQIGANDVFRYEPKTPLKFETSIVFDSSSGNISVNMHGWQEDNI